MAEKVEVEIPTGKSKEEVALWLFDLVRIAEGKSGAKESDRAYILSTYAECLEVVQTAHYRNGKGFE